MERGKCPGLRRGRGGPESEGRFREQWFRRWFREWFRELVVAGMVSRPVPGGGCRMVPEWFRADAGEVPGGSFGGGYGHGGRPSDGDVRAGWFGLPGAARGREYTDFSGGRYALIILFVADY